LGGIAEKLIFTTGCTDNADKAAKGYEHSGKRARRLILRAFQLGVSPAAAISY
jgi:hypothetical protein